MTTNTRNGAGRRLCAHADDDGRGMHWLEPGERCPAAPVSAVTTPPEVVDLAIAVVTAHNELSKLDRIGALPADEAPHIRVLLRYLDGFGVDMLEDTCTVVVGKRAEVQR